MSFMKVYQIIYYIGYFYFHLVEYVVRVSPSVSNRLSFILSRIYV
jgi:hypothetical protein